MPKDYLAQLPLEVTGRTNQRGRVYYDFSSKGDDTKQLIPEQIVLKRWRKLSNQAHVFHGCRLGPNVWQPLGNVDFETPDWIEQVQRLSQVKTANSTTVGSLAAMRASIGAAKLSALNAFCQTMLSKEKYGTPDLFLWVTDKRTGKYLFGTFAEVKKPKEPTSRDQKLMLWVMRRMRVNAAVIRLRETSKLSVGG
jgi:hypothetical protein